MEHHLKTLAAALRVAAARSEPVAPATRLPALRATEAFHQLADVGTEPLDQLRVEARASAQRRRVHRCPPYGQPGKALLVHQCGDGETVPSGDLALKLRQGGGSDRRLDRRRAIGPRQLSQTMGHQPHPTYLYWPPSLLGAVPAPRWRHPRPTRRRRAALFFFPVVIFAIKSLTRSATGASRSRQVSCSLTSSMLVITSLQRAREPAWRAFDD